MCEVDCPYLGLLIVGIPICFLFDKALANSSLILSVLQFEFISVFVSICLNIFP